MTAPIARIEPLQILRALAAILIMAKHVLYEVDLISPIDFNYGNYKHYVVGIDIFFVLSGFIMIYISQGVWGFQNAKEFFLRRVVRIVPIYWFYTAVLAVIAVLIPQVLGNAEFLPLDFIKSLFFVPYVNTAGDLQPLLANGWSLNYEMYFYLIFALCLLLPMPYSLLALSGYFLVTIFTNFAGAEGLFASFYSRPIILEFLAGAIIGFLFLKNIRLPSWCFYIGVVFVVSAVMALFFTDSLDAQGIGYNKPLVGILSVLLLVLPKGAENLRMPRWGVKIGDSSYTLYLAHPFAIGAITQLVLLTNTESVIHPWFIFVVISAVSIYGSFIAYNLIEKPALKWSKKLVFSR